MPRQILKSVFTALNHDWYDIKAAAGLINSDLSGIRQREVEDNCHTGIGIDVRFRQVVIHFVRKTSVGVMPLTIMDKKHGNVVTPRPSRPACENFEFQHNKIKPSIITHKK